MSLYGPVPAVWVPGRNGRSNKALQHEIIRSLKEECDHLGLQLEHCKHNLLNKR